MGIAANIRSAHYGPTARGNFRSERCPKTASIPDGRHVPKEGSVTDHILSFSGGGWPKGGQEGPAAMVLDSARFPPENEGCAANGDHLTEKTITRYLLLRRNPSLSGRGPPQSRRMALQLLPRTICHCPNKQYPNRTEQKRRQRNDRHDNETYGRSDGEPNLGKPNAMRRAPPIP